MSPPSHDVTELLQAWGRGHLDATSEVDVASQPIAIDFQEADEP